MKNLDNKSKMDYNKKHIFTIKDNATGKTMKSEGELGGWDYESDYSKVHGYYYFKTKNNESRVKKIELKKNGTYTINAMMRNVPIPDSYEVIGHEVEEMFSDEEKKKNDLLCQIHTALKRKCCENEYIKFSEPIELNLQSISKTVKAEYFTSDWFGVNDIINYQTDHVRMNTLSNDDLEYVYSKIFA